MLGIKYWKQKAMYALLEVVIVKIEQASRRVGRCRMWAKPSHLLWRTLSPPLWTMGDVRSGRGQPSRENFAPAQENFEPNRKLLHAPPNFEKSILLAFLEGRLTTNPMLSALHLQDLTSNIYVHFHLVNKPLIGISFWKWNHQWRT